MNHLHFIFQTLFDNVNAKAGKNKMADSENMDTVHLPGGGDNKASKKRMSVERIYQKKSQLEHILLRPDSYIGSTEIMSQVPFVVYTKNQRHVSVYIVCGKIHFSPMPQTSKNCIKFA